jgi:THO complex subunit 7
MVSNIAPLSPDEEGWSHSCLIYKISLQFSLDAILHSRITNDERALRRVVKKFSNYTTVAYHQLDPASSDQSSSAAEDAREAFLIELSSFGLQLKKAVMVCEAEARQVEEYHRERQRIGK